MDEELWRDWPQDPRIKVSNKGNVVSCKRGAPYALKVWRDHGGYQRVGAAYGSISVHRLVADTWIDNPNHYKEVNHIDGDKDNNSVENLEWTTRSENVLHAYRTGLNKGRHKGTPVRIVETGETFESQRECARRIGGNQANIARCLAGEQSTHLGFHFEYA